MEFQLLSRSKLVADKWKAWIIRNSVIDFGISEMPMKHFYIPLSSWRTNEMQTDIIKIEWQSLNVYFNYNVKCICYENLSFVYVIFKTSWENNKI